LAIGVFFFLDSKTDPKNRGKTAKKPSSGQGSGMSDGGNEFYLDSEGQFQKKVKIGNGKFYRPGDPRLKNHSSKPSSTESFKPAPLSAKEGKLNTVAPLSKISKNSNLKKNKKFSM
jgi:hypothetical protein